jgi:hypothetical protein
MSSGKKSFRVEPSNPQIDPVDLTAAEVRNLIGICIEFVKLRGRVTGKFAAAAQARRGKDCEPARSGAFLRSLGGAPKRSLRSAMSHACARHHPAPLRQAGPMPGHATDLSVPQGRPFLEGPGLPA